MKLRAKQLPTGIYIVDEYHPLSSDQVALATAGAIDDNTYCIILDGRVDYFTGKIVKACYAVDKVIQLNTIIFALRK